MASGALKSTATITTADIQIGAVEIKNGASDQRATVNASGEVAVAVNTQAAHDAAIAGNPVRVGARALTANYTAVATGDTADLVASTVGALIIKPYSVPELDWSYAAASGGITDTNAVTIKAAAGAGLRNYLTALQLANSGAAGTAISIRDGSAGTVVWRGYVAAAFGTTSIQFANPLKSTADTLLEVVLASGMTVAVYVDAQGYVAP